MGGVCSRKNFFRDIVFIPYYKDQMIQMLHTIIDRECNPEQNYEGETRRVKNLKKQTDVVRGLTKSWHELTDICVDGSEHPPVIFRKILDELSVADKEMRVSDVLCMCTYVIDVCVKLDSKNKVCEMVEILVNYMLDHSYMSCVKCLYWLDNL